MLNILGLMQAMRMQSDSASSIERHQNATMKRMMGDVRRVISRKGRHHSPSSSHRTSNSSDSRSSGQLGQYERHDQLSAWQQLRGPPRVDMLGEKIEGSYKEAFEDAALPGELAKEHKDSSLVAVI